MEILDLLKSPSFLGVITIILLLCTYVFTFIYNQMSIESPSSLTARFVLLTALITLMLMVLTYILFFFSLLNIAEIREFFDEPSNLSILTSTVLFFSYLSTIINGYISKIYGEASAFAQIFFYIAIIFLVFFFMLFIALLVSFSSKFFYPK